MLNGYEVILKPLFTIRIGRNKLFSKLQFIPILPLQVMHYYMRSNIHWAGGETFEEVFYEIKEADFP